MRTSRMIQRSMPSMRIVRPVGAKPGWVDRHRVGASGGASAARAMPAAVSARRLSGHVAGDPETGGWAAHRARPTHLSSLGGAVSVPFFRLLEAGDVVLRGLVVVLPADTSFGAVFGGLVERRAGRFGRVTGPIGFAELLARLQRQPGPCFDRVARGS